MIFKICILFFVCFYVDAKTAPGPWSVPVVSKKIAQNVLYPDFDNFFRKHPLKN